MNNIWSNIFKGRKRDTHTVHDILKKIPVFDSLSRRELVHIERILHQREYRQDETIFLQGDPGLGMYIIENGTVAITCEPSKHLLAELHAGEFFGELSLLDDAPRTATAMAKTPVRLLCFFQPELVDLIDRHPRMGVKVMFRLAYVLGERLKRTNEHISELKRDFGILERDKQGQGL